MAHGGINYVKRHIKGSKHEEKYLESQKSVNIHDYFAGECQPPSLALAQKVMSNVIRILSFLDPPLSQKMPLSTFDAIEERFGCV